MLLSLQEVHLNLRFHHVVSLDLERLGIGSERSLDILRRSTYQELIFALGNHPCRGCFIERCEF